MRNVAQTLMPGIYVTTITIDKCSYAQGCHGGKQVPKMRKYVPLKEKKDSKMSEEGPAEIK